MSDDGRRVAAFHRCAAQVFEWDPDDHDGAREPWESIEATMDAGWPDFLRSKGAQLTMDAAVTERDTNPATGRRRVLRWAWTLPLEVPEDLARRCRASVLNGVLMYDASTAG